MTEEEEEGIRQKNFEFYLLLNWREDDIKLYKREPGSKKIGPYDIPIECNVAVEIPDSDRAQMKGKITLSEEKVDEMTIAEL